MRSLPPCKSSIIRLGPVAEFLKITSLQGKKLDQLYPKSNEFHTSRRSWYLPISPSPDHPDAGSKKAKKRFPTLALADGATLRWDSYVNIRHVYKIDWTLLKPYSNVNTPRIAMFQLERDSLVRMIAKGKILTLYAPSEQMQMPALQWISTAPPRLSTSNNSYSHLERGEPGLGSPDSDHGSVASRGITQTPANYGSDFRRVSTDGNWSSGAPQGEPPDPEPKKSFLARVFNRLFTHHQRERSRTRP